MKLLPLIIISLTTVVFNYSLPVSGKPTENQDSGVEVQKQSLVKFPDDVLDAAAQPVSNRTDKQHEAEHILQEIAKINEAFGYVKKPAHSASVLDSAQYLYPQPAYHPMHFFQHHQHHQPTGPGVETLLVPSIRAISYERGAAGEQEQREQLLHAQQQRASAENNALVHKSPTKNIKTETKTEKPATNDVQKSSSDQSKTKATPDIDKTSTIITTSAATPTTTRAPQKPDSDQKLLQKQTSSALRPTELKLAENANQQKPEEKTKYEQQTHGTDVADSQRPSQTQPVQLPLNPFLFYSQGASQHSLPAHIRPESPELMTHFAIPVRLYKLNREEYLSKHAPKDYPFKGYKIVGDINDFYGQSRHDHKSKAKSKNKNKSKPKPTPKYQLFLLPRDLATISSKEAQTAETADKSAEAASSSSREEKFAGHRPFKIQASANTMTNNNNGITNSTTNLQLIRKRIIPRPFGGGPADKESAVESSAGALQQQRPGGPLAGSLTSIRITPPPNSMPSNMYGAQGQGQGGGGGNHNNNNNNFASNFYKNNTNAIKTAFQNIFKFPFRQPPHPQPAPPATEAPVMMQAVPLQQPLNSLYTGGSMLPQPFYVPGNQQGDDDYRWEDDDVSNSAAEEEDNTTEPQEEKHIFLQGQVHHNQMQLQKEALKRGGIIIQRLKVRKGGIAIAGPGGVATAGSGGTAIVGPGGYALTHPRSLTIAGPGAKVIAIPADVDLQDALGRTNLSIMSFPREGKIVATGPTVYYDLGTGEAVEV